MIKNLVLAALYWHELGKNMINGRPVGGGHYFFDVASDF
jgi:hypothetical protein